MNISKKAKTILFICCAFLLSIGILTTAHFLQTNRQIPTEEKPVATSHPIRTKYDIASASEEATTIVYGTLGPKGEIKRNETILSNGEPFILEHYRDAEIQVIQMIKGDMNAETVYYWELSDCEEEDMIYYTMDGTTPTDESTRYTQRPTW